MATLDQRRHRTPLAAGLQLGPSAGARVGLEGAAETIERKPVLGRAG